MKVLAVIPARGGSKRIRGKNLRLIQGMPLIGYVLKLATGSALIDTVVITSDDEAILDYARSTQECLIIRERPAELAGDEVTLDPVVFDAVAHAEESTGSRFDIVVTLQPTSPTLTQETLDAAIRSFISSNHHDSCLAAVEDTHLRWGKSGEGFAPLYQKRLNRQWLPKTFRETGAFFMTRREFVTEVSRLGKRVTIHPLAPEEAIDIDDPLDWIIAEGILSRRRIAIVVNGNRTIGMGHVYRALTLAQIFFGNRVVFFTFDSDEAALGLMRDRGYDVEVVLEENLLSSLQGFQPHIVINDILDTELGFIEALRLRNYYVVNFEDLGEGSEKAHLVFNALYELSAPPAHHRFGAHYVCLSPQFLLNQPASFREEARTLLITFGGADENNLTLRACRTLEQLFAKTSLKKALVVLGPGFAHDDALNHYLSSLKTETRSRIEIRKVVQNMAKLMREADLAVTSNGRTIYELASMGIPGVSVAQNDRETLHLFSRYSKGFVYLGISSSLREELLAATLEELLVNASTRMKMRDALLGAGLRGGANRVKREIWEGYWRWNDEVNQPR